MAHFTDVVLTIKQGAQALKLHMRPDPNAPIAFGNTTSANEAARHHTIVRLSQGLGFL
jgi:hypothetical protein